MTSPLTSGFFIVRFLESGHKKKTSPLLSLELCSPNIFLRPFSRNRPSFTLRDTTMNQDRLNRMDNQIEQKNNEQHVTSLTNTFDSSSVVHDPMSIHEHILANVSDLVQQQDSSCDEMMNYNLDNAPNGEICPRSLHSAETVCYFSSDEGSSVPIKNTNRDISQYDTDSMEGFANEDTPNNVRRVDSIESTIHDDETRSFTGFGDDEMKTDEVTSFGNTEVVQNQGLSNSDSLLSHVENQDVPNEIVNQVVAGPDELQNESSHTDTVLIPNVPKIDKKIVTDEVIDVDLWCPKRLANITKILQNRGSPYGESSRTGKVVKKRNTHTNNKKLIEGEVIDLDLWYDGKTSDIAKQCKNQVLPNTKSLLTKKNVQNHDASKKEKIIDVIDLVSLCEPSCSYTNVPEKLNDEPSCSNKVVENRVISDGEVPSVSKTLTKRQDEDFKTGDLIWAKMGKYPFWPSVVCIDPSTFEFIRGSKSKRSFFVHVRFCNDCGRRSWVRVTLEYSGRDNLLSKYPLCLAVYRNNKKQMELWEGAVEEADSWINCSREERLQQFSEKYKLPIDTLEFKDDAHYMEKNNLRPCYVYIQDFRKDENGKRNLEALTINDPTGSKIMNSDNATTGGTKQKKAKKRKMPKDKSDKYGLVCTSDEDTSKEEIATEIPKFSSHPRRVVPFRVKRSISGMEEKVEERLRDRPIKTAVRRLNKTKNAQTNKKK